jgi:hypothetical protein
MIDQNDYLQRFSLVDINKVKPHEDVIPESVKQISKEIDSDGVQLDPIIIDRNSMIILDGMHRLAALKYLGAKRILTFSVDYTDSLITVGRWIRCVRTVNESLLNRLRETLALEKISNVEKAIKKIDSFKKPLALISPNDSYISNLPFKGILDAYDPVRFFDQILSEFKLKPESLPESEVIKKLGYYQAVLYTPPITKEDIIKSSLFQKLFPFKSTMHFFPDRPIGVSFPLDFLIVDPLSHDEIQKKLEEILKSSSYELKPSGSSYRGRVYQERLFVFHR